MDRSKIKRSFRAATKEYIEERAFKGFARLGRGVRPSLPNRRMVYSGATGRGGATSTPSVQGTTMK